MLKRRREDFVGCVSYAYAHGKKRGDLRPKGEEGLTPSCLPEKKKGKKPLSAGKEG